MTGVDHEGKPHGEHVTITSGNRRKVVWYEHGVIHRDDKPAVTIGWTGDVNIPLVEIYVQNGLVHRPVPAGANSEDYPSIIYHLKRVSFWHSEGTLVRARQSTSVGVVRARERKWVDAVIDNVQNTVTADYGEVFHFNERGFFKQIDLKYHIEFWSEDLSTRLIRRHLHLDTPAPTPAEACDVCLDNKKIIAFGPCGHVWCNSCASKVDTCPLCNARITSRLRIYI
jgi:hypothetical protein